MSQEIAIRSRLYWVKVVGMLEQNWALIDDAPGEGAIIYFVHDRSGVFDSLPFPSRDGAERGLRENGFAEYYKSERLRSVAAPPQPPFTQAHHPNGPIYSSGRFWHG